MGAAAWVLQQPAWPDSTEARRRRFIFRLQELDMVQLAHSCALLQMPRMPELAHRPDTAAFQPSAVDTTTIQVPALTAGCVMHWTPCQAVRWDS